MAARQASRSSSDEGTLDDFLAGRQGEVEMGTVEHVDFY